MTAAVLSSPVTRRRRATTGITLLAFATLLIAANRWGEHLRSMGVDIKVRFPPLYAAGDPHVTVAHLVTIAIGIALLVWVPRIASREAWQTALVVSFCASIAWAVTLNVTRGAASLVRPLQSDHESLRDIGAIGSPLAFVRDFTANLDGFPIHTQGHPPGFVLVLWLLDEVGLRGANWAAAVCIAAGAAAVVTVLVAVRDVAGEAVARQALPFVALAPVGLWVASSADAFFAGLGACAVAAIVRGIVRPDRPRASLIGGALFGLAMLCSYGAVLLIAIPGFVAARQRRFAPLLMAGVATGVVLLVAFAAGFDYLEGLARTHDAYVAGVAADRPYSYALLANLAALAIVIGPATVVGLTRLRGNLGWLVGGAFAAVVIANLSGMSKLEVERIWLPFAMWLLPAAAALRASANMGSRWLALQMAWALSLQTLVRTGW